MIQLTFVGGRLGGRTFSTGARTIRIGRDPALNELVVDDASISQRHCVLEAVPPDTYLIRDLGSANGVVIGERKVESDRLVSGDRIRLGEILMEVTFGDARIRVLSGSRADAVIRVAADPITFGAAADNTVVLTDAGVAPYHAALLVLPTGYELRDNSEGEGITVNDRPLSRATLTPGDLFQIGASRMQFGVVVAPRPAATILAVPPQPAAEEPPEPVKASAQLVFLEGVRSGTVLRLGDEPVTFGRADDNTIVLTDVLVSAHHCGIARQGGEYVIEDRGSTNGTVVNGHRLTKSHRLVAGDRIGVGTTLVEFKSASIVNRNAELGATMVASSSTMNQSSPALPQPHKGPATATAKVPIMPANEKRPSQSPDLSRSSGSMPQYVPSTLARPWRPATPLGASSARIVAAIVTFAAAIAVVVFSLPRR